MDHHRPLEGGVQGGRGVGDGDGEGVPGAVGSVFEVHRGDELEGVGADRGGAKVVES